MTTIEFDLPGYDIIEKIGSGGMASVYRANQHTFQRNVALKILRQDLGEDALFSERFIQESLIVAKLHHSHIVQVYDVGEYKNWFYVAMEFLSKGNLSEAMENDYLSVHQAITIFSQILSALAYSHEKKIVHRDVKPDNIMFRDDGAAVLTDFGIAKDADSAMDLTQTGTIMGTPKYMSPEQIRGATVGPTSDLYSLGIVLFHMFTGKVPFSGTTMVEVAFKHLNDPIPSLPKDLEKYQPLINGLLVKNPAQRIQSGGDAQRLLKEIQELAAPVKDEDATVILQKYTPPISDTAVTEISIAKLPEPENTAATDQNSRKRHFGLTIAVGLCLLISLTVFLGFQLLDSSSESMISQTEKLNSKATETEKLTPSPATSQTVVNEAQLLESMQNETPQNTEALPNNVKPSNNSISDSLFLELQIKGLLRSAEIDLREGRLTHPKNNNALDKYQRILIIDPSNVIAQEKIDELKPVSTN